MNEKQSIDLKVEAKTLLLSEHFCSPGHLYGTDILSGEQLKGIYPVDEIEFFRTHQLGPGRCKEGAAARVATVSGEEKLVNSFYRPLVRPFDAEGMASFFCISVIDQPGLEVTETVLKIIDILRDEEYEPVVERSFRLCRWEVWVFLNDRYRREDIKGELCRIEARIRDKVEKSTVQFSALDDNTEVYLPYQFFAGGFFGQLYQHLGEMEYLDLSEVPSTALGGGDLKLVNYVGNSKQIETLVLEWWKAFEGKAVRAGQLLQFVKRSNLSLADLLIQQNKQAQAIQFGNMLIRLEGKTIAGKTIAARQSGNSHVYSLNNK